MFLSWWRQRQRKSNYDTYPVNLIKYVRLEDNAAHDTSTGSSFQLHFSFTKEEVEISVNGGRISLLRNGELGTIITEFNIATGSDPAVHGGFTLGEVRTESLAVQAWVRLAGLCYIALVLD